MTMLEDMIRAIGGSYDGYADPVDTPSNWSRASSAALAALQAIKKPSPRVVSALSDGLTVYSVEEDSVFSEVADHDLAWSGAIDAILSEGEAQRD